MALKSLWIEGVGMGIERMRRELTGKCEKKGGSWDYLLVNWL